MVILCIVEKGRAKCDGPLRPTVTTSLNEDKVCSVLNYCLISLLERYVSTVIETFEEMIFPMSQITKYFISK